MNNLLCFLLQQTSTDSDDDIRWLITWRIASGSAIVSLCAILTLCEQLVSPWDIYVEKSWLLAEMQDHCYCVSVSNDIAIDDSNSHHLTAYTWHEWLHSFTKQIIPVSTRKVSPHARYCEEDFLLSTLRCGNCGSGGEFRSYIKSKWAVQHH